MTKPRLYRMAGKLMAVFSLVALLPLSAFLAVVPVQAENFADPSFRLLWQRTDLPVADNVSNRPYLWGDTPFATRSERYDESPSHLRTVQYFDKGRMELTYPGTDPSSPFYVSSGLLVRDLVGGIVQVGDNQVQLYDPAQIAVVGDPTAVNPTAPTYADFLPDLAGPAARNRVGTAITSTIQAGRKLGTLSASAQPDVKYAYYETHTNHNIAEPFWNYFATTGTVFDSNGAKIANAHLFDWQYLMGYPISEAYWTTVKVGGKDTSVLVQLFERRVLSYTPSNPAAFQVEMGNVGQHYYQWRYVPVPITPIDRSVPDSVSGSITPKYGGLNTVFSFQAIGFSPNENVDISISQPDGSILSSTNPVPANAKGEVGDAFQGSAFTNTDGSSKSDFGIYGLHFKGLSSAHLADIYFRLVQLPPLTPTTPYNKDEAVPASVNAEVSPKAGPRGTNFVTVLDGFTEKDFALDHVGAWVTSPEGAVSEVFDVSLEDVTPFGVVLALGSPPRPGIWAVTFQDKQNAQHKSVVYLRVTEAPPEVTIGAAFSLLQSVQTAGGSGLFARPSYFHFQLRQPAKNNQE